jgi:ribonuclease HI
MQKIEIYTDGACKGNPGIGGWAAILISDSKTKEIHGSQKLTTNNQMELKGVIEGLKAVKKKCLITLYTDSKYVVDGVNSWLKGWKKNGWKNSQKKEIANIELWKELDELVQRTNPVIKWVKGHSDNIMNQRADDLANFAVSTSFV